MKKVFEVCDVLVFIMEVVLILLFVVITIAVLTNTTNLLIRPIF